MFIYSFLRQQSFRSSSRRIVHQSESLLCLCVTAVISPTGTAHLQYCKNIVIFLAIASGFHEGAAQPRSICDFRVLQAASVRTIIVRMVGNNWSFCWYRCLYTSGVTANIKICSIQSLGASSPVPLLKVARQNNGPKISSCWV